MSLEYVEIYKTHVQSADKLDERRDTTVRTYGSVCAVIVTVATGIISELPLASLALWVLLIVVASIWTATLGSLTAKLIAKADELREMEKNALVPHQFLTNERERWEAMKTSPLQVVAKQAPNIFRLAGVAGIVLIVILSITG